MSLQIHRFNVATPTARPAVQASGSQDQASSETSGATMATDSLSLSSQAAPQYPTVGDYVKKRFYDGADSALTGFHAAAELLMPPLLIGEMAGISVSHKKAALDRIWNLPMDPQGHWKVEAQQISRQERAKAHAEIRQLPLVHAVDGLEDGIEGGFKAIGRGVTWLGHEISADYDSAIKSLNDGFNSAGHFFKHSAEYVVDGFVSTGVAIGKGIESAGVSIQNGSRAAGQAIKQASHAVAVEANQVYDAAASGVRWVGTQAVEVPKAAARTVLHGIGDVGQGMVTFSQRTEPLVAPRRQDD